MANLSEKHYKICMMEEIVANSSFIEKVKNRAYFIYLESGCQDHCANYYKALNELRKKACKC